MSAYRDNTQKTNLRWRDAVVVDSLITQQQARAQADWIAATGKNLTTIYATHGHSDHFFGASVLLERFPKARFVAAPSAIQVLKEIRARPGLGGLKHFSAELRNYQ